MMASRLGTGPSHANGGPAVVSPGRFERALTLTTPDESQRVAEDATGQTLFGVAMARRVLDLLHYEVLIRLREDPEDVHHARSTIRRLRAMLRGFRKFLDRAWVDTLREELRWFAGELAGVRDVDVTLDALRARVDAIPHDERPYVEAVFEPLEAARVTARSKLLETLDNGRYRALLRALEAAATSPRFAVQPEPVAEDMGRKSLQKAAKRICKAISDSTRTSTPGELHHARIVVRNGRYVAEACCLVLGKPAQRMAKRLERMQEALGAISDNTLIQERLRSLVVPDRANRVIGEMLALEAVDSEKARRDWQSLRRKALREEWFAI
ncbi:MAG: CHAD domain-containing protein [Candidatus Eremiobacteraeota bacterium]|nr:CHAD domain-containing protein [Candidatus Eremiobacteraeota bacterium]